MTLTGNQFEIAAGPYRAVVTEAGAALRLLTHDGHDLILPHDADEPAPAAYGQLLAPWPNRIDHGRYSYGGAPHQLDISEPPLDCAIHGLVRWVSWTVAEQGPDRIRLAHRLMAHGGYPYRLDLEAEYTLDAGAGLTIRLTARNTGSRTAPYAHGAHPYLTVGEPIDSCTVSIPAGSYLPTDDRKLPTGPPEDVTGTRYDLGEPAVLGDRKIDNAYTGLRRDDDGRLRVRLTNSAGDRSSTFWMDDAHPWLEIYTADEVPEGQRRLGIGVEPMTCPPNAFVSGIDVIDLKPGDTTTGSWGIMAG
jgi:aldose 1-epimerase